MDTGTPSRTTRPDLGVRLGTWQLANPVMPASGCFGPELAGLLPVDRLGAVVTKTIFARVRAGNPAHRLAETPHGMLNSVGIPSPGIDVFRSQVLPAYRRLGPPVVVSVGGLTVEDYLIAVAELAGEAFVAIELNVSCPNLEAGGLEIGADPHAVQDVTRRVVELTDRPVLVKLTPNAPSVTDIALAAQAGGASAVTVANTFVGLAVDHRTRRPVLGNTTGGLSGPAVKPLVMRLVWEVSRRLHIPVVACGGVSSTLDAVEFILAGASAVQVGTATFTRPDLMVRILDELPGVLAQMGVGALTELRGQLRAR